MSGRLSADERLRRSLAMVPWVVAEDGPTVDEVCRRFGYEPEELGQELEQLFMCGLYPFTGDVLVEADIVDDRVIIRYPYAFGRPLRLTPQEALALLAATSAILAEPGADAGGPLARGMAKLAELAGEPGSMVVELGTVKDGVLEAMREAETKHRLVEFDYYSYGRDAHQRRRVAPYRVHNSAGQWYATGWCHSVDALRRFRLDRVSAIVILDETFIPPADLPADEAFSPNPQDPVVSITVAGADRWIVEQYPVEEQVVHDDGSVSVSLRISEGPWLERLLLRLGATAVMDDKTTARRREAARRVLGRYQGADLGQ